MKRIKVRIPLPYLMYKKIKIKRFHPYQDIKPAKFFLDEIGQGVDANWVQNIELMEDYIRQT